MYVNERHRAEDKALRLFGTIRQRGQTMKEEFGPLLRMFRERSGRSRNNLSHEVGVDPSYSTRIEAGDRDPPRLHIVDGYARALRLSLGDRNRLLVAAGYVPLSIIQMGGWDACLQSCAEVLTDPHLTPEERDAFRDVVSQIAARWRGIPHPSTRLTNGAEVHA